MLPSEHLVSIATLGALTNFIVGVYDLHLDGSAPGRRPIKRSELISLFDCSRRRSALDGWRALSMPPPERLFLSLVREFTRRLDDLVTENGRIEVKRDIVTTVVKMYDAQHSCHKRRLDVPIRVLQNKGALPFVVMGAPAWFVTSQLYSSSSWHLSWLYRLGDFFSLIDDTVDLYSDSVRCEPNRIERILRRNCGSANAESVANSIAFRGAKLYAEWMKRGNQNQEFRGDISPLAMVVTSWMEGSPKRIAVARPTI
jgi:hypothetical protein